MIPAFVASLAAPLFTQMIGNGLSSVLGNKSFQNALTGSGLTGAQWMSNGFDALGAAGQMAFQAHMSNTAYQRQIKDMKLAGVNPALAMSGSANGAAAPAGAMPSSESPGSPDAVGLLGQMMNLALLDSQKEKIDSEAALNRKYAAESSARFTQIIENTRKLGLEGDALEIANSFLEREKSINIELLGLEKEQREQSIAETRQRIANLSEEQKQILQSIVESKAKVVQLLSQASLNNAEKDEISSNIKFIDQSTSNLVKSGDLLQKDINWYTHDKIAGDIGVAGNIVGNIFGIGSKFKAVKAATRSSGRVAGAIR